MCQTLGYVLEFIDRNTRHLLLKSSDDWESEHTIMSQSFLSRVEENNICKKTIVSHRPVSSST